jgi:hypothetical protein
MNSSWVSLWVFGALLAGILLLAAFGCFRRKEGFQASPPAPSTARSTGPTASIYGQELIRCPVGYTPFHSPAGDSMCCKGTINPYTHQCSSKATDAICSLSINIKDPRNPKINLPQCSDLLQSMAANASLTSCPESLKNYAQESEDAAKCCKNPIVIKGAGFGCSSEDLLDKSKYCIVKGDLKTGEQRCDALAAFDGAACPKDSSQRDVFQKITYQLGEREADYYKTVSYTHLRAHETG